MEAEPGVGFLPDSERAVRHPHPRLDAEQVVAPQPPFIAARRVEIGHAAARRVRRVIRALRRIARLTPPMTAEYLCVAGGGKGDVVTEERAVRRGRTSPVAIELVVPERVAARVRAVLVVAKPAVSELGKLAVVVAFDREVLPRRQLLQPL